MRATLRIFSASSLILVGLFLSACGKDEPVQLNALPATDDDETDDATDDVTDDSSPSGTSSSTGRPGQTPTPTTTPGGSSAIGRPCAADGDCAQGLRCMMSSGDEWLSGGPANGYCTADCIDDPFVCSTIDTSSFCLQMGDETAVCIQGCLAGGLGVKCQGRGDVACDTATLTDGTGFCRPMCRNDDDCDGRKCDLGNGACLDDLPVGDPVGTECDPDAEISTCESGLCLPLGDDYAVCTGLCTYGETGCGSPDGPAEDGASAVCAFPFDSGAGVGDVGLCIQRCSCDGDCLHSNGTCVIVPDQLAEVFGAPGLCFEPDYPDDDPEFTVGRACEPGADSDGGRSTGGSDSGAEAGTPKPSKKDAAAPTKPVEEAGSKPAPVDASNGSSMRDQ